jgi:hypothetical protein
LRAERPAFLSPAGRVTALTQPRPATR